MKETWILIFCCLSLMLQAQAPIPDVYSNLSYKDEVLHFEHDGKQYPATDLPARFTIPQLLGKVTGTDMGCRIDFGDFEGSIVYGMIPYGQAPHPLPVFRFEEELKDGKVTIDIKDDFKYPYDIVGWSAGKPFHIGYRLLDKEGMIVFDGEVGLQGTGPFKVIPAIYEGPFLNKLSDQEVTIWFRTTQLVQASVIVGGQQFSDAAPTTAHEITVTDLKPDTEYSYVVQYGPSVQQYSFRTAPLAGSRSPFVFAYSSDSRHARGGGERKIYGTNAYITKKIAALAHYEGAAFLQFSGDMINGYLSNKADQAVQLSNWKKSVEVFWHYMPFNVTQGNHEALGPIFLDEDKKPVAFIDAFPFETESAEALMQEAFVNPENGPESEDGASYDPNPDKPGDFPSYKETVYHYTYGNVAMVVLNSDYWYAPFLKGRPETSGGLHAYIMDKQLEWLEKTLKDLEGNPNIDHVFVTQHTPAFPNGGHSGDDMWYGGDNSHRAVVAGKPLKQGIIERRDAYLDLLANKSSKVVALLTGDEHNYNWLKLTNEVPIYPEDYPHEKLQFSRPLYQINNGAAGAPYYAQEKLPWSAFTQSFSVENALCLFYVEGESVFMRVLNPDTLNEIDRVKLR